MAIHTDTEIYKTTFELSKLVSTLVANMPKSYKFDFGAELRRDCMWLVRMVYQANTSESNRVEILNSMREEIESVNLTLRLSKDLRLISTKQYANAIALTESIGKQAKGWQKYTERAQEAGLSRQSGHSAFESGRAAGSQGHRQAHNRYRRHQPK